MGKKLEKTIEIILIIMFFSIFMSFKAFLNVGALALLILGIIKVYKSKEWKKEKLFYWYFGAIFIGIVNNLINGRLEEFFSRERSLIYILIFVLLNLKGQQFDKIKNSIIYSGLISAIYSGISYFTPKFLGINTMYNDYRRTLRMQSFTNLIRWGSLLQILTPFSLINFVEKKGLIKKIMTVLIVLLFLGNIIINGTRAGMVGIFIAFSFLVIALSYIYKNKVMKFLIPAVVIMTLFIGYLGNKNPQLKDRITSITSTTNSSNRVRLDFYKIGFDIIKQHPIMGIGCENSKTAFAEFISKQNPKYLEKYYNNSIAVDSGTPFENNYINLAIENGVVYVFSINLILLLILIKILKRLKNIDNPKEKIKILILISTIIGNKVFIFFFPGTDSYVEFIVIFLMFYAYELSERTNIKLTKG